jgi:putative hydrolase of the HAD superfamily
MGMIKAIIFDFYGVIRSNEYRDWRLKHDISLDEFKKSAIRLDMGKTSPEEFFDALSKLSGISAADIQKEFSSNASLNKDLLNLIYKLKTNYLVALISNANSSNLRDILASAGIDKLFDQLTISSEVGYVKPSPEIFNHTLEKLGIKAGEAVFVDDNYSFVQTAESIGMKGIHYTDLGSLINAFKKIGIMV